MCQYPGMRALLRKLLARPTLTPAVVLRGDGYHRLADLIGAVSAEDRRAFVAKRVKLDDRALWNALSRMPEQLTFTYSADLATGRPGRVWVTGPNLHRVIRL